MHFKLKDYHHNLTEQELLNDLKRVAARFGDCMLSTRKYDELGKFKSGTIHRRFGNWNKALQKAGLCINQEQRITDLDLFSNLEAVWVQLGRQPTYREMCRPLSKYSTGPYAHRFGSWRKALLRFVEYMNTANRQTEANQTNAAQTKTELPIIKHKTKRTPGERLKVQVLMRDGNKCRLCGKTLTGNNIHFDHIVPWSRGGETVLENLQVLCKKHNYAKGNLQ